MAPTDRKHLEETIRRFFQIYPDYWLCRTLAENILEGTTTEAEALQILGTKAKASDENRGDIEEKLDRKTIPVRGQNVRVRSLSLRDILDLDDVGLQQVVQFYFKHPYAHQRTYRTRWLPNLLRTFFLRVLLGNARDRNLELNYRACFQILRLL